MLHRAADSAGHVEFGVDRLAALTDLPCLREPVQVRERTGCTDDAAHGLRELLDERQVLLLLDPATGGHDHVSGGEIDVLDRRSLDSRKPHPNLRRVDRNFRRHDTPARCGTRRLHGAGSHRHDNHPIRCDLDLRLHLLVQQPARRDQPTTVEAQADRIRYEGKVERPGECGAEIVPLSRVGHEQKPRLRGFEQTPHGKGVPVARVLRERHVLDEKDLDAEFREAVSEGAHPLAEQRDPDDATRRRGEGATQRDDLEGGRREPSLEMFRDDQDVARHRLTVGRTPSHGGAARTSSLDLPPSRSRSPHGPSRPVGRVRGRRTCRATESRRARSPGSAVARPS